METLSEFLGVSLAPDAPAPDRLEDIADAKAFGNAVLQSREFRLYILSGLALGDLPGFTSVLLFLLGHAVGKPVERVEVKDTTTPPEELTAEQLEERSMRLAEMARYMRRAEEFDEPVATDSVH